MHPQAPDPYDIEERAAIMEFEGGLTREEAEAETARLYGFYNWRSCHDAANKPSRTHRKDGA